MCADGALIHAPRQQVVLAGTSSSLNCSYPDSLITWRRQDNSLFGGRISDATFADEGVYTCDIYVPASAASITISVTLYIVGKYCHHFMLILLPSLNVYM